MYALRRRDTARFKAADADRYDEWCRLATHALDCTQETVTNDPATTLPGHEVRLSHVSALCPGAWRPVESLQWHHTIDNAFNTPPQRMRLAATRWWDRWIRRIR